MDQLTFYQYCSCLENYLTRKRYVTDLSIRGAGLDNYRTAKKYIDSLLKLNPWSSILDPQLAKLEDLVSRQDCLVTSEQYSKFIINFEKTTRIREIKKRSLRVTPNQLILNTFTDSSPLPLLPTLYFWCCHTWNGHRLPTVSEHQCFFPVHNILNLVSLLNSPIDQVYS